MAAEQRDQIVHPIETRIPPPLCRAIGVNKKILGLDGSQVSGSEIRRMLLEGVEASERQAFASYDTQASVPPLALAIIPPIQATSR